MTRSLLPLSIVFASLLVHGTAWSQYGPPPPPPSQPMGPGGAAPTYYGPPPAHLRRGLLLGLSVGASSISQSCDICTDASEGGLSGAFRIGGFINPRLAILFEGWGTVISPSDGDYTEVHTINTVAVQGRLSPRFWLKGGVGFGQIVSSDDGNRDPPTGFAISGAAGYELAQSGNFAFDVSLQLGATFFEEDFAQEVQFSQVALLAGFNWY